MSESSLAYESVKLFMLHENTIYSKIDRKNKEVDLLVSQMEDLEKFMALVTDKLSEDTERIDLTDNEQMELVDNLREKYPELERIFPHGKYTWKGEAELENLKRQINQHIEGPLQRKITMGSEEILLEQHELTKALEIFRSMLTRMNNQIDRILSNIQKIR